MDEVEELGMEIASHANGDISLKTPPFFQFDTSSNDSMIVLIIWNQLIIRLGESPEKN